MIFGVKMLDPKLSNFYESLLSGSLLIQDHKIEFVVFPATS